MYARIKTVNVSDEKQFEDCCNDLLSNGWKILSTSCGFANSEKYDFCSSWQAILIKE